MKKIIGGILLAMSFASFAGEKVNVTVTGMVCSFCSQGITKKFQDEKAVKNTNVNLDQHLVTLELHDGQSLAEEKIKSLLQEAGYGVSKIERQ